MKRIPVNCAKDGRVVVGAQDVRTITWDLKGRLSITFTCPVCSGEIVHEVKWAAAEIAIIHESYVADVELPDIDFDVRVKSGPETHDSSDENLVRYFRHQLKRVQTVEDILDEFDPDS